MTGTDLGKIVASQLPNAYIAISDKDDALPTSAWLFGPFAKSFKRVLFKWRLFNWRAIWDCDNFASEFRCHAQRCHARTRTRTEEGLAVGELWYVTDHQEAHAVNLAVVEGHLIVFVEPQTCKRIYLSDSERQSCWFVRF